MDADDVREHYLEKVGQAHSERRCNSRNLYFADPFFFFFFVSLQLNLKMLI